MFFNLENFSFLQPLIDNKHVLLSEYINYKKILRENDEFLVQRYHLNNLENYNLFTSFVMCIFSEHQIGTGQVTNGLFNFSYFMPDRNFFAMESFFRKKFDINYKTDSLKNKMYFAKTLELLKDIPNLTQGGYSEYKNNCVFEPHTHEKGIYIFHVLLNSDENNTMYVSCKGADTLLDKNNDYILFKGSDIHEARVISTSNMITFGLSFYEK